MQTGSRITFYTEPRTDFRHASTVANESLGTFISTSMTVAQHFGTYSEATIEFNAPTSWALATLTAQDGDDLTHRARYVSITLPTGVRTIWLVDAADIAEDDSSSSSVSIKAYSPEYWLTGVPGSVADANNDYNTTQHYSDIIYHILTEYSLAHGAETAGNPPVAFRDLPILAFDKALTPTAQQAAHYGVAAGSADASPIDGKGPATIASTDVAGTDPQPQGSRLFALLQAFPTLISTSGTTQQVEYRQDFDYVLIPASSPYNDGTLWWQWAYRPRSTSPVYVSRESGAITENGTMHSDSESGTLLWLPDDNDGHARRNTVGMGGSVLPGPWAKVTAQEASATGMNGSDLTAGDADKLAAAAAAAMTPITIDLTANGDALAIASIIPGMAVRSRFGMQTVSMTASEVDFAYDADAGWSVAIPVSMHQKSISYIYTPLHAPGASTGDTTIPSIPWNPTEPGQIDVPQPVVPVPEPDDNPGLSAGGTGDITPPVVDMPRKPDRDPQPHEVMWSWDKTNHILTLGKTGVKWVMDDGPLWKHGNGPDNDHPSWEQIYSSRPSFSVIIKGNVTATPEHTVMPNNDTYKDGWNGSSYYSMTPSRPLKSFKIASGGSLRFTYGMSARGMLRTTLDNKNDKTQINESWDQGTVDRLILTGVTDIAGMLPRSYRVADLSKWDVSSVKDMSFLFYGMSDSSIQGNEDFFKTINSWNTTSLETAVDTFGYNSGMDNVTLSGWDWSHLKTAKAIFYYWSYNCNVDLDHFCHQAQSIEGNAKEMFALISDRDLHELSALNTSKITNMSGMFDNAIAFNGDISKWDTSNVTNMSRMFYDARTFNGDISKWDTSNVTDMNSMFSGAASAFNGDISNWDTSNVTRMDFMFQNARRFNCGQENVPGAASTVMQHWDTSKVTTMYGMFYNASVLWQDLSTWNVDAVREWSAIFSLSGINGYPEYWPEKFRPAA